MINTETISKFINIKGLKGYITFILIIVGGFLYLQLNGILLYNSTSSEHEGNSNTYGNNHHK
jgi:hypothetical protein